MKTRLRSSLRLPVASASCQWIIIDRAATLRSLAMAFPCSDLYLPGAGYFLKGFGNRVLLRLSYISLPIFFTPLQ